MANRGTLIVKATDTRFDVTAFNRAVIATNNGEVEISGGNTDGSKLCVRAGRADATVNLTKDVMEALNGVTGPVRFVMTLRRNTEGGKVYRVVPATTTQVAHAVIRERK